MWSQHVLFPQTNEDSLVYSAPVFTRTKVSKAGSRGTKSSEEETIYTNVSDLGLWFCNIHVLTANLFIVDDWKHFFYSFVYMYLFTSCLYNYMTDQIYVYIYSYIYMYIYSLYSHFNICPGVLKCSRKSSSSVGAWFMITMFAAFTLIILERFSTQPKFLEN